MSFEFKKTKNGIETDTKVQAAAIELDKFDDHAIIEVGHDKETGTSTCKISGMTKRPIVATDKTPARAVRKAVGEVKKLIHNNDDKFIAKKRHARADANKIPDDEFGL